MSYYPYSKNPTSTRVATVIASLLMGGLFCFMAYVFSNQSVKVLVISIAIFAVGFVSFLIYYKNRLFGVFLYDETVEISKFRAIKVIRYSEIKDMSYLGYAEKEPTVSYRFTPHPSGGSIISLGIYVVLHAITLVKGAVNNEKGFFTGGNSNDCVRLVIERDGIDYIIVFSTEDNSGFLNELSLRAAAAKN